jgi:hypothetical protein
MDFLLNSLSHMDLSNSLYGSRYLFHSKGTITIPFYDYDPDLFTHLRVSHSGFWDADQQQFVLKGIPDNRIASICMNRPRLEIRKGFETSSLVSMPAIS